MPHVIFVAPAHPPGQRRFVRGLKKVGARVTGIGDTPPEHLDPELQYLLDGYEVVGDLSDEDALEAAVRRVQSRGPWVDRLEATLEPHLLAAARVRARTAIPGEAASAVGLSLDRAAASVAAGGER